MPQGVAINDQRGDLLRRVDLRERRDEGKREEGKTREGEFRERYVDDFVIFFARLTHTLRGNKRVKRNEIRKQGCYRMVDRSTTCWAC